MQPQQTLKSIIGDMDIYLLDQVMKGRYIKGDRILDAGCGEGRNLTWFVNEQVEIFGVDINEDNISYLKTLHPKLPANQFQVASLTATGFADNFFNHIICSAVLHFAENEEHFFAMLNELVRIVNPGGSLFIRMTSDIGIEKLVTKVSEHQYLLPDGSVRFLLTRKLLKQVLQALPVILIEPFKTVNVDDIRCMSTLLLQKQ